MKEDKPSLVPALSIGVALAIFLACIDLIVILCLYPKHPPTSRPLFLSLTVTSFLLAIVYTGLTLASWAAKLTGKISTKIIVQTIVVGFVFIQGFRILGPFLNGPLLLRASLALFVSLGVGLSIHFLDAYWPEKRLRTRSFLSHCLPFLLLGTVLILWLYRSHVLLSTTILFAFTEILLVGFVLGLLYRLPDHTREFLILAVFGICIVGSCFIFFQSYRSRSTIGHALKKHPIKHVILITIDTLRADISRDEELMPHVRHFAQDSMEWTNAYSAASWTLPAFASIMTGHSPLTHLASRFNSEIPSALPRLAEYFQNNGYITSAIGHNVLLNKKSVQQGFDRFTFFPRKTDDRSFGTKILSIVFRETYRTILSKGQMTNRINDWIRENQKNDFFLWVHFLDPHCPYKPSPQFLPKNDKGGRTELECDQIEEIRSGRWSPDQKDRNRIQTLYKAEAKSVDDQVGKLLDLCKKLGIYDDALIVIASDHGEEFWEHGRIEHGHSLYNELLHVLLMIKTPHSEQKGRRDGSVTTQAILPTMLTLTGLPYHDNCIGASLLSTSNIKGGEANVLLAQSKIYYEPKTGVIWDNFKYILNEISMKEELYDLKQDSAERTSLVKQDPADLAIGRMLLAKEIEASRKQRRKHNVKALQESFDEEQQNQLKALGYMQ